MPRDIPNETNFLRVQKLLSGLKDVLDIVEASAPPQVVMREVAKGRNFIFAINKILGDIYKTMTAPSPLRPPIAKTTKLSTIEQQVVDELEKLYQLEPGKDENE